MPALQIQNLTTGVIPVGTLVIIQSGKARAYDAKTDTLDDVVGAVYASGNTSGRAFNLGDGPDYYNLDANTWDETLLLEFDSGGNPISNPNYDAMFNPFADTTTYSTILTHGMGVVLASYTSLPSRWRILQSNTTYNWVLIR